MELLTRRHPPMPGFVIYCLALASLLPGGLSAKSLAFHPPELELAVGRASLIVAARVSTVTETTVVSGGKLEQTIREIDFEPVESLKGLFVRDLLTLTSQDLGNRTWVPREGELRLLLLGRSGTGYQNVHRRQTLDESMPVLDSQADPLLDAVELLIDLTREPDRGRRIELLLNGLETASGTGAVPLLESLGFRALLAAQHPNVTLVARLLTDASPEVRTAAARTLGAILEADYLANDELAEAAVTALAQFLGTSDTLVAARVAAFDALGVARSEVVSDVAADQLNLGVSRATWAEAAAVADAVGQRGLDTYTEEIIALAEDMQLDSSRVFEEAVQAALIALEPIRAAQLIERRIRDKHLAGLEATLEIELAGRLPTDEAVALLLRVPVGQLSHREKVAFAVAGRTAKDQRLVPALAQLLEPGFTDIHWQAVEALREIDTVDAAEALRPFLAQETNLGRKLQIAEFLGRHGIDAGATYAFEHMSQPSLLEPSIAVLVALGDPESIGTLRSIVRISNDIAWTGAAIRALGALGDVEIVPELLSIAGDLRNPLAPYALVALGDLGELQAADVFRAGMQSRDDEIVAASVRGAASLIMSGKFDDGAMRDTMQTLLASADADVGVRRAALRALRALDDARLDAALAAAVLDAGIEHTPLLGAIEELLEEREIQLLL